MILIGNKNAEVIHLRDNMGDDRWSSYCANAQRLHERFRRAERWPATKEGRTVVFVWSYEERDAIVENWPDGRVCKDCIRSYNRSRAAQSEAEQVIRSLA